MSADPLITQLRALAQSSPDFKPAAQLYEIILPIISDVDLRAQPIALTAEQARAKLAHGEFLLRDEPLALDPSAFRDLLTRLARSLDKLRKAARPIRTAIEKNKIEVDALLPVVFSDDRQYVDAKARELQLDSALLWTLAQNAIKPAFRAWAAQLSPLIKGGRGASPNVGEADYASPNEATNRDRGDWERAACYICGAVATLGELQGNDQFRHLRCGRCGADWESRRLVCIYCSNENPKTLGKLYVDQRQPMHAQVCDNCKGYLKVINAFSPNPPEMLTVQDLATVHLDFIAQKHGYAHGVDSMEH
jgi:formate dehydrogenase formation protein